jgi:hypothetical protein
MIAGRICHMRGLSYLPQQLTKQEDMVVVGPGSRVPVSLIRGHVTHIFGKGGINGDIQHLEIPIIQQPNGQRKEGAIPQWEMA